MLIDRGEAFGDSCAVGVPRKRLVTACERFSAPYPERFVKSLSKDFSRFFIAPQGKYTEAGQLYKRSLSIHELAISEKTARPVDLVDVARALHGLAGLSKNLVRTIRTSSIFSLVFFVNHQSRIVQTFRFLDRHTTDWMSSVTSRRRTRYR